MTCLAPPLVSLRQLSKTHNRHGQAVEVLRSVCLTVAAGDFCAITGPSGSGKTTLLQVLGLLEPPTGGSYCLDGQPMGMASAAARARARNLHIGFVFQSFHLLPALSAQDNVALPLLYRGVGRAQARLQAAAALEQVGLADRMAHTPQQLSGGQQQRVAMARAVVGKPRLLLADEPTGNLDADSGQGIVSLLQTLNAVEKTTIIMITHDARLAAACPRRLQVANGQLTELR